MQDLRGSKLVKGKHPKNKAVFAMDWDLIIYDEAHEGTQTDLGQAVQTLLEQPKAGKVPKVLQLSGTPYNIQSQYSDGNMFPWGYVDEQRKKRDWGKQHPGDHNPYADLPELRICTFDLRNKLGGSNRYEDENIAFNFREFFRTWTGDPKRDFRVLPTGVEIGDFVHADDVRAFLDLISADSQKESIVQSEAEVRSKLIVPIIDALGYPSYLRAEEFPVYGFSGGKQLPTTHGDFVLFSDREFALHRKFNQEDLDWVHQHSLRMRNILNLQS